MPSSWKNTDCWGGRWAVILLYLVLLYRGMRSVSLSQQAFGGLLSAGLSFAIVIQAMANMSVAVGPGAGYRIAPAAGEHGEERRCYSPAWR